MSQQQLNLSPDIYKLVNEGYEVEIKDLHLLVHSIPYVNQSKEVKLGTIISKLVLAGQEVTHNQDHVAYFVGDFPSTKDGNPIVQILHQSINQNLTPNILTNHSFSNKPQGGYKDYYEKMVTYINIISGPAIHLAESLTPKTYKPIILNIENSVFAYDDSNSSRTDILSLRTNFKSQKIGIIGLGGTGSYILDFISKTPVEEIRLIDGDDFLQHNAFRTPSATSLEELKKKPKKTDYLKNIYSNMHKVVQSHPVFLSKENLTILDGLTFIFICVDKGPIKKIIIDYLLEAHINFIDVGMGIDLIDNKLRGQIRVTSSKDSNKENLEKLISFSEGPYDEYNKNIQIAELNALNAIMAVIKWKKMLNFYHDIEQENHTIYDLDGNHITNEKQN